MFLFQGGFFLPKETLHHNTVDVFDRAEAVVHEILQQGQIHVAVQNSNQLLLFM